MKKDYTYIVLADDDEDDRMLFTDALAEMKISAKVDTFKNGAELMNYLLLPEETIPEILFLDLNMPKKGGLECLEEIRKNKKFQNMAVAIYSTSSSEEHIEETFVKGANVYIKKPNNFEELKKVLSQVVTMNWQFDTLGMSKENFLLRL